jgi:erythromycin esterase-like protein
MRLVIDLDLDRLPNDPAKEVRRILGFWAAWLPKMDLTRPTEQELHDSNHQAVGVLRLIEANATDKPEAHPMSSGSTAGMGWCFGADGTDDLGAALGNFLGSLRARPRLLGLGEPMHGEEEFPRLRNEVFRQLVEREGYRSVSIESDCLAALTVDAYVAGGEGSLDDVMEIGFSHGFGALDSNRELVAWIREHNRDRAPADRLRFYGFDAPTEITGAASPRQALTPLHDYLATHLEAELLPCDLQTIDRLVGDDGRWTDPAVAMDPSRSVGASREANELRLVAYDLCALLASESPRLVAAASEEDWWRACLRGRTAAGLLRYHAAMADGSGPRAAQMSRLMVQRDTMMAENLQATAAQEARRGPTLAFAQNSHLQKHRSELQLPAEWGGGTVSWWSAGAIAGAQMGDRYAFLASSLGSAPEQGLGVPKPDTLEGALYAVAEGRCIFDSKRLAEILCGGSPKLTPRTEASTNRSYSALDPDRLDGTDGIVFVKDIPSPPIDGPSPT